MQGSVRQLIFAGESQLKLRKSEVPSDPSLMIVKMLYSGICGSDLKILRHGSARVAHGRVMGHEGVGIVLSVPDSVEHIFERGDIVAIGSDFPCLECVFCKTGRAQYCEGDSALGHEMDGLFSTHVSLPHEFIEAGPIVKIESVDHKLAFVLTEPLACVIRGVDAILARRPVAHADKALISGAGTIGLLAALLLQKRGVNEILLEDNDEARVNKVNQLEGFQIEARTARPEETTQFDYIFVAHADDEAHRKVLRRLASSGVINFFGGVPSPSLPVPLSSRDIHYRNLTLLGTHGSSKPDFLEAASFIESNVELCLQLVGHCFPIEDHIQAFRAAARRDTFKVAFELEVL